MVAGLAYSRTSLSQSETELEPTKKVSQIDEQLDKLNYLLGEAETWFLNVELRCASVSSPKSESNEKNPEPVLSTPLGNRLLGFNQRLANLVVNMQMFCERVEL